MSITPDADQFGDIEEALAGLFEARTLLETLECGAAAAVQEIRQKVERACHLLDRPWSQ